MNHSIPTFRVEEFKIESLLDFFTRFDTMNNEIGSISNKSQKYQAIANRNTMMNQFYRQNVKLMSELEIVSFISTMKGLYKKIVDGN